MTDWISWILPAYDNFFDVQEEILAMILVMRCCHCIRDIFFVDSGMPRYLNGKSPHVNPNCCKIFPFSTCVMPPKYTELFPKFACSPETLENWVKLMFNAVMEERSPLANNSRSSAKHRWVMPGFAHLGWWWNSFTSDSPLSNLLKYYMGIVNKKGDMGHFASTL